MRDRTRCGGAIVEPNLALVPVAADPLSRRALAHLGGQGRLAERPTLIDDPPDKPQPLLRCEGSVTVELHPVTSLGLGGFDTPSLQGGPDEQRGQELHLEQRPTRPAAGCRPVTGLWPH